LKPDILIEAILDDTSFIKHRPDASTSETSVNFYQTTRLNNPEDSHLHTRRHENLKSYLIKVIFHHLICNFSSPSSIFGMKETFICDKIMLNVVHYVRFYILRVAGVRYMSYLVGFRLDIYFLFI
jgi:hypothetical protein